MGVKQNGYDTISEAAHKAAENAPRWLPCPEGDCDAHVPAESIEITVRLDGERLETRVVQVIGSHPHDGCAGADVEAADEVPDNLCPFVWTSGDEEPPCRVHGDGAHHCSEDSQVAHARHVCNCGEEMAV